MATEMTAEMTTEMEQYNGLWERNCANPSDRDIYNSLLLLQMRYDEATGLRESRTDEVNYRIYYKIREDAETMKARYLYSTSPETKNHLERLINGVGIFEGFYLAKAGADEETGKKQHESRFMRMVRGLVGLAAG